ncbi:hypothetical protein GZH53_18170 [Flavihumibacter sp. R14]|nr:hypothetical protein [Flavihumibacter soli]
MNNLAKYAAILSIIPAVYFSFYPGKIVLTTIICSYPLIIGAFLLIHRDLAKNIEGKVFINLFIAYNIIVLFRGGLDSRSTEDWNVLVSSGVSLTLFIPFSIYIGAHKAALTVLVRTFLTWGLILCALLFFATDDPGPLGFTHTISPIYFLILLIPYMESKYRSFIVAIALISFFSDITIRSNLLNILVAFIIMLTFFLRRRPWILKMFKYSRILILTFPLVFLLLGIAGIFNIFSIGESFDRLSIKDGKGRTQDVFIDSRTGIYMDVFSQLESDNSIVFGLGGSGKTKTSLTDNVNADFDTVYKEGRRGTESGMLNYIQWGGMVGGAIYFLLFIVASYYGIHRSRNWFCIMLGLWVAYKGLCSFIEDSMIFSISSIFILVPIGICLSREFRSLGDSEIKFLVKYKIFRAKRFILSEK